MEEKLENIIKEFNRIKNAELGCDSAEAMEAVKQLQNFLSEKFPCDIDALFSFSELYRQESFKKNIDTMSSEGNANFIADAIESYCLR